MCIRDSLYDGVEELIISQEGTLNHLNDVLRGKMTVICRVQLWNPKLVLRDRKLR